MISNVSANRMKFIQNGTEKNYIQIGTVMTDENYRKQGLAAKLMEYVIEDFEDECDGFYLFGDLSAEGFYKKSGFKIIKQHRYFVKDEFAKTGKPGSAFKSIDNMGDDMKKKYFDYVRNSRPHSSFEQINKFGLQMFYTSGFDNVFYAEDIDCFIVTDQDDGTVLQSVLSKENVAISDVLQRLEIEGKCRLGFTPLDEDKSMCVSELYDGADDYRLFYRGDELKTIEEDKLYFPDLSHA